MPFLVRWAIASNKKTFRQPASSLPHCYGRAHWGISLDTQPAPHVCLHQAAGTKAAQSGLSDAQLRASGSRVCGGAVPRSLAMPNFGGGEGQHENQSAFCRSSALPDPATSHAIELLSQGPS